MEQYYEMILGKKVTESIDLLNEAGVEIELQSHYDSECGGLVKTIYASAQCLLYNEKWETDEICILGEAKIHILKHLPLVSLEEGSYCCDTSQQFLDAFETFFVPEKNSKKMDLETYNEFVYIEEFHIDKDYRSKGFGYAIIREIIELINKRDSLVVVLPFAIEDRTNETAHKRVENFWKKLGFKKWKTTGYLTMDRFNTNQI